MTHDPYDRPAKRPDSYWGAIKVDCDNCGAKGETLERDGEKCTQWIERLNMYRPRKMPCLARIKKARASGYL